MYHTKRCGLCTALIVYRVFSSVAFDCEFVSTTVVPFSIMKSANSLCADFVAGSTSHGSIPLTASCALLH